MVLAAGAGTRLRPITFETPKPMVPVANRPVLHHVLDNLSHYGIRDAVLNLHSKPEQIKRYCGDGTRWGMRIRYSPEAKLLGTAGGVKKVQDFFKDGTFLVVSGDGLHDVDYSALAAFHKKSGSLATMVVKAIDTRFDYGVTLTGPGGRIKGFREKPSWGDVFSNQVNTGIYMFEPEVFRYIPQGVYDFGHQLWPKLLKLRKPIFAWEWKGYWCDVGNLHEYRKSQVDALDGKVRLRIPGWQMRQSVWVEEDVQLHPSAVLKAPCLIGAGVTIGANCTIGPYTVVGEGSRIQSNAILENCILFDHVSVNKNVHLSNCIIGPKGSVRENITVYEAAVLNIRQ